MSDNTATRVFVALKRASPLGEQEIALQDSMVSNGSDRLPFA